MNFASYFSIDIAKPVLPFEFEKQKIVFSKKPMPSKENGQRKKRPPQG